jgi:hypothetical protein
MQLGKDERYLFVIPKDPELNDQDPTFLEKPGQLAERITMLRDRGYYLEDREVLIMDKPVGKKLGTIWMSELVADYFEPCELCGSYGGKCICDDEADR